MVESQAPASAGPPSPPILFAGLMVTSLLAAVVASNPVRSWIARVLPIEDENPVHSLGLALSVMLLGTQISSLAFTDVLGAASAGPPLTLADLIIQELPFAIVGAAGVGLFIRRDLRASAGRLGLVVPTWWQVCLALTAAGAFFAASQAFEALGQWLTPQIAQRVQSTSEHVFGGLSGWLGVLILAVGPGICEEILFRGALQPRLGLVLTALLFTSLHSAYGVSFDLAAVFAIALGLGAIRRWCNTTTSSLSHLSYNLLVGIGVGGALVGWAVAIEVGLIALTCALIWSSRRKPALTGGLGK